MKNKLHILVSGCCGFVGSHLCREFLKEGHRIIGIDDMSCGFYENIKDIECHDFFDFAEI